MDRAIGLQRTTQKTSSHTPIASNFLRDTLGTTKTVCNGGLPPPPDPHTAPLLPELVGLLQKTRGKKPEQKKTLILQKN